MKAEVIQEKFSKALNHVSKSITGKPNIPVLNNVLITAKKGKLELSTTNLDIGITAVIGAEVEKEGSTTVSAKLLAEFVNTLKPGKVSFNVENNKFVVNSVDNNAEFFTINADEFPSVPRAEGSALISLNAVDFSDALNKTTFAASSDNSRPILTGVLTKITSRKLTLVAVDGFRLSQKVIDIKEGLDDDFKEVIPARTLIEVSKIIKDVSKQKDEVEFYLNKNKNQIIFKIEDIEVASRLIEGEFPNYEDIIPTQKEHSYSVLKEEFADILKIVSIFARNAIGNKTKFRLDPDSKKLSLRAEVVDVGKNEVHVDIANVIGESLEVAYNAKFVQDMIGSIDGDEVFYESGGTMAPGVFKDSGDESYLHIIMPMKLD